MSVLSLSAEFFFRGGLASRLALGEGVCASLKGGERVAGVCCFVDYDVAFEIPSREVAWTVCRDGWTIRGWRFV